MKFIAPFLVGLSILLSIAVRADTAKIVVTATVTADGEVVDKMHYTPKTFDDQKSCEDFLKNPDERFTKGTDDLKAKADAFGYKVELKCEPLPAGE